MVIKMDKVYLCIDLKTFFASVECVERGLDPFKTDLVVADESRGKGSICLAISPKMKARGIKNRCRVFEIPKNVKYITALPRMKKYIEYSANIYGIYLKYIDSNDIHVYSIDEAFLDITSYLKLYKKTPIEMAQLIISDIYKTTGITATAGIGTNLYLAKIALDIMAKHSKTNIGYLDLELYKQNLWHHTPLTDFWQIGKGIEARLNKLGLHDMYDVSKCDEKFLYKEFGINAKLLIDHSYGIEPCTINEIKKYKPKSTSISSGQILFKNYDYKNARKVLIEMVDSSCLELVKRGVFANNIYLYIGYAKDEFYPLKISRKLDNPTHNYSIILNAFLEEYDKKINSNYSIKRINIGFGNLTNNCVEQLNLFDDYKEEKNEDELQKTMNLIKDKYGKNSILRCISYDENATQRLRNKLIGGHNAE